MTALKHSEVEHATIVALGEGGCGKSSLIIRFVNDMFAEEYDPTIEDSFRKLVIVDGRSVFLDIIDTAGQEEFICLRDTWIRNADGFLLIGSVTAPETIWSLNSIYSQIIQVKEFESPPCVVVANKKDLKEHGAENAGKLFAQQLQCPFIETSAKNADNVVEAFISIIREVKKRREADHDDGSKGTKTPVCKHICTIL